MTPEHKERIIVAALALRQAHRDCDASIAKYPLRYDEAGNAIDTEGGAEDWRRVCRLRDAATDALIVAIDDAPAMAALELDQMECPSCKRPADVVNHVLGHIFVGWGIGWQMCSRCHGTCRVDAECLGTPTCHGQTPYEHVPACPCYTPKPANNPPSDDSTTALGGNDEIPF